VCNAEFFGDYFMAQLELYILNIVANPHPPGVYPHLLRQASRGAAKARGSDYAKITKPRKEREGVWSGRILIWTEIDMAGRWLDLVREDDLPKEVRDTIAIPARARPNYRVFQYVFDEKKHLFYYEHRNERGEKLGPTIAKRVLSKLLSREFLGDDAIDVEVTIVPDRGAVGRILRLPGLKRLHIRLNRPNPDDFEEKKRRILKDLQKNHARRMDTELIRAPGTDKLTPTGEIKDLAEVAAENGFVEGESDGQGHRTVLSTREFPQKIILTMDEGRGVLARLLAHVRQT
jgi:hypothetical protein